MAGPGRSPAGKVTYVAALCALAFGLLIYCADPRGHGWDFHQFYAVGTLPAADTYDVEAQRQAEERIWREDRPLVEVFNYSPYLKPAYYRLVFVPLAKLPFWTAYRVWVAFQVIAALAALWLLARRYQLDAAVVMLLPMCPYLMLSFTWGQDTGLLLLLITLSLELGLRKREGWAGAVLALGLVKWNTILAFPLAFLVQKRWRTLAGFSAVAVAEVATSVWITGLAGVRDYLELSSDPAAHFWSATMPCVRGILLALGTPQALAFGVAALAVGLFLWKLRDLDWETTYAAASSVGVFLAFHTMGYDLALAVVGIAILFDRLSAGWKGPVVVFFLSPIPYIIQKFTAVNGLAVAFALLATAVVMSLRREVAEPVPPPAAKAMAARSGAAA